MPKKVSLPPEYVENAEPAVPLVVGINSAARIADTAGRTERPPDLYSPDVLTQNRSLSPKSASQRQDQCSQESVSQNRASQGMLSLGSGIAGTCVSESAWSAPARLVENPSRSLPYCQVRLGDVYGHCATHTVKILKFKRYERFRELFFESDELAPCRDALRTAGLSMDLSQSDLGQGKLVVPHVQLAMQAMIAIRLRQIHGVILRKSDVVVSADMEQIVRSLAMNNPATMRKNQHVTNEPGELLDVSL